jgi:ferredoxin
MQSARRCLTLWHRLQELGGIHNSYAERALAASKAAAPKVEARAEAEAPAAPAPAPPPADERIPGAPWIETARCPSCNECQLVNDKLFLYNENKQAYLGDLKTGTYRQMVEAAESCQVSIIHPGKPWDPNEPGLAELVERAEPFQ